MAAFIVIEGLDGSGTTTQVDLVHGMLEEEGVRAAKTRNPSSGALGAVARLHIRGVLTLDERAMALTFSGDRLDQLAREVDPALAAGAVVICDRFYLSTMAYQSVKLAAAEAESAEKIDWRAVDEAIQWIYDVNRFARRPDRTFFLDVDPAECATRMARSRWHQERYDDQAMLSVVDAAYRRAIEFLSKRGEEVAIVSGADREPEAIAREVRSMIEPLLASR